MQTSHIDFRPQPLNVDGIILVALSVGACWYVVLPPVSRKNMQHPLGNSNGENQATRFGTCKTFHTWVLLLMTLSFENSEPRHLHGLRRESFTDVTLLCDLESKWFPPLVRRNGVCNLSKGPGLNVTEGFGFPGTVCWSWGAAFERMGYSKKGKRLESP